MAGLLEARARLGLKSIAGKAANSSLSHVQRSHGRYHCRSGEKCETYPWSLHEMRLRLSLGNHQVLRSDKKIIFLTHNCRNF